MFNVRCLVFSVSRFLFRVECLMGCSVCRVLCCVLCVVLCVAVCCGVLCVALCYAVLCCVALCCAELCCVVCLRFACGFALCVLLCVRNASRLLPNASCLLLFRVTCSVFSVWCSCLLLNVPICVLCCVLRRVVCCVVLRCAVLCYAVMYYVTLCCVVLCCGVSKVEWPRLMFNISCATFRIHLFVFSVSG